MEEKNTRPPVVVVVGHVDHGKTSLLDAIRKTSVVRKEAGGITQSIGATTAITESGKVITFVDTPGHALFASMRGRGVNLADIAILVVASDDGVQPQTKEAIKLLQESQTPFVVALTKIDLATASIDTVLPQLEKEGVFFEKRGGEIPYVGISSKTGEGIKELLDLISLISEVNGFKGSDEGKLEGYVIETSKDKRGLMVSMVAKDGRVRIGETIYAGGLKAKVKGIFDDGLKPIKEIGAGYAGQILGFEEVPEVGSQIAQQFVNTEKKENKDKKAHEKSGGKLKIFVKARTAGSLEALIANIPGQVELIGSGVGDVTETDIFLAKAANANLYLFEAKFQNSQRRLAENEGVKIFRFDVIYDLIDQLKEIIVKGQEEVLGKAQIMASFPFDGKRIAGSKVLQGRIQKTDNLRLMRGDKELGKVRILSIKKQKQEVMEVKQGEECGILFSPQLDFTIGDVIISVR